MLWVLIGNIPLRYFFKQNKENSEGTANIWKLYLKCVVVVLFFQKNKDKMSSLSEQPCYTLINIPSDAEPPTEIQLKTDLGK